MATRFAKKTRKHCKKQNMNCLEKPNRNAKKATQVRCLMKTCRAKKYQSVYGSVGGSVRSNRTFFF